MTGVTGPTGPLEDQASLPEDTGKRKKRSAAIAFGEVGQISIESGTAVRETAALMEKFTQFKRAQSFEEKGAALDAMMKKIQSLQHVVIVKSGSGEQLMEAGPSVKEVRKGLLLIIKKIKNEVGKDVLRECNGKGIQGDKVQQQAFITKIYRWLAVAQQDRRCERLWELVGYHQLQGNVEEAMMVLQELAPEFPEMVKREFVVLQQHPTREAIFTFQAVHWSAIKNAQERKDPLADVKLLDRFLERRGSDELSVDEILRVEKIIEYSIENAELNKVLFKKKRKTLGEDFLCTLSFVSSKFPDCWEKIDEINEALTQLGIDSIVRFFNDEIDRQEAALKEVCGPIKDVAWYFPGMSGRVEELQKEASMLGRRAVYGGLQAKRYLKVNIIKI